MESCLEWNGVDDSIIWQATQEKKEELLSVLASPFFFLFVLLCDRLRTEPAIQWFNTLCIISQGNSFCFVKCHLQSIAWDVWSNYYYFAQCTCACLWMCVVKWPRDTVLGLWLQIFMHLRLPSLSVQSTISRFELPVKPNGCVFLLHTTWFTFFIVEGFSSFCWPCSFMVNVPWPIGNGQMNDDVRITTVSPCVGVG